MAHDETLYLRHVLDAMDTVEEYLLGVNEEKFKNTRLIQDGVIRQIESSGKPFGMFPKTPANRTRKFRGKMWQGCAINSFMVISV
ncbi:MAG: hypothetical protein NTW69_02920 [Chloroflexi bacterium]|nr:hypothetical protein [Chloroflexota bacterium]